MKVLVVGGAGYIGSHMCKLLAEHGHQILVLDDLSTGHREAVRHGRLIVGDVADAAALHGAFSAFNPDAVIHFAGKSIVSESLSDPAKYYRGNFVATAALADYMRLEPGRPLIFSSTAAVFGTPLRAVDESHPRIPINPYGASKLAAERMLRDYWDAYQLPSVTFRYFNSAGADPSGLYGEEHEPETHLIPLIFDAILGRTGPITINGDDYDTPDGTCIRDFVHVNDLCQAHLAGIHYLLKSPCATAFNLGNGAGHSVLEVVQAVEKVVGLKVPYVVGARRIGDPPRLVANSDMAKKVLGWQPQFSDIETIIETAWRWHQHRFGGALEQSADVIHSAKKHLIQTPVRPESVERVVPA